MSVAGGSMVIGFFVGSIIAICAGALVLLLAALAK